MAISGTGPARLTASNLQAILEDIPSASPGWHPAGDLYRWFSSMCVEEGLEAVSATQFGRDLRALGYRSAIQRLHGKRSRCWFLTRRAFRG